MPGEETARQEPGGRSARENSQPQINPAAPAPQPLPRLTPERAAAFDVPAGVPVASGRLGWWCPCPSCQQGAVPLLPAEDGRLEPAPIASCVGNGWNCSRRRIAECWAECWAALCAGREIEPTASEAWLGAGVLVRRFPELWHGRRGRDRRAALWAVARELDALELPPRLVRLGVEGLAAHRWWRLRLVREVLT